MIWQVVFWTVFSVGALFSGTILLYLLAHAIIRTWEFLDNRWIDYLNGRDTRKQMILRKIDDITRRKIQDITAASIQQTQQVLSRNLSGYGVDPAFGGKELDTAIGSVRGYRWWKLNISWPANASDAESTDYWEHAALAGLFSLLAYNNQRWEPRISEYQAICAARHSHIPPADNCGCGFWAYWDPKQAIKHATIGVKFAIQGVIEGYGTVLIGSKGFRCEKARIVALRPVLLEGPYSSYKPHTSGFPVISGSSMGSLQRARDIAEARKQGILPRIPEINWDLTVTSPEYDEAANKIRLEREAARDQRIVSAIARVLRRYYPDPQIYTVGSVFFDENPPDENYGRT